jgi:hypothetical protein
MSNQEAVYDSRSHLDYRANGAPEVQRKYGVSVSAEKITGDSNDQLGTTARLLTTVILHRLSHWAEGTRHEWDVSHRIRWNSALSSVSISP